ncbi:MAG TPA: helix-turn-helix domain-containing protein [Ktedonobacterales bacterium]
MTRRAGESPDAETPVGVSSALDDTADDARERALALLCQGMRAPAIAAVLGVSASTVRRWLRQRFETLLEEARDEHQTVLLRAIESHREVARAAWEAYEQERILQAAVLRGELDRLRRRAVREGRGDGDERILLEEYERPRLGNQGARYLAVALAAQREVNRLQGLYDRGAHHDERVSITITRRPPASDRDGADPGGGDAS